MKLVVHCEWFPLAALCINSYHGVRNVLIYIRSNTILKYFIFFIWILEGLCGLVSESRNQNAVHLGAAQPNEFIQAWDED